MMVNLFNYFCLKLKGQKSLKQHFNCIDGEASSVQRQVSFPVWSNEECKRIYRPYYFEENYICAGIRNGGKDACQVKL